MSHAALTYLLHARHQTFERLVVSKEEALELFKYNAFKAAIITNKIPDGGFTTVYRNGDLIDLCRCVRAVVERYSLSA